MLNAPERIVDWGIMHKTIEALYKDGRIIPLGKMIPVREAKVFVTFLDEKRRQMTAPGRKNTLKLKTYLCGGKLRDFTREDAYADSIRRHLHGYRHPALFD
jgi:hypothetical protein